MESNATDEYVVFVADNFHYMVEDETYREGAYPTLEAAIAVCKDIVDRAVLESAKPGQSPQEHFSHYTMFGDDPFIIGPVQGVPFSAWDYAKERCRAICGGD